jgi:hypothetical protein
VPTGSGRGRSSGKPLIVAAISAGHERGHNAGRSSSWLEDAFHPRLAGRNTSRQVLPDLGERRGSDRGRDRGSGPHRAKPQVQQLVEVDQSPKPVPPAKGRPRTGARGRVAEPTLPRLASALAQQSIPQLAEYSQPEFETANLVERVGPVRRTPFALEAELVGRQLGLCLSDHRFDLGQLLRGASWQCRRPVWVKAGRVTPSGALGCASACLNFHNRTSHALPEVSAEHPSPLDKLSTLGQP